MDDLRARRDIPLQFFKDAIMKYKGQINDMKEMPILQEVGKLLVNSKILKEEISPSPTQCLQEIEKLLPELAKIKNEELLTELNAATNALSSSQKTVIRIYILT